MTLDAVEYTIKKKKKIELLLNSKTDVLNYLFGVIFFNRSNKMTYWDLKITNLTIQNNLRFSVTPVYSYTIQWINYPCSPASDNFLRTAAILFGRVKVLRTRGAPAIDTAWSQPETVCKVGRVLGHAKSDRVFIPGTTAW